MKHLVEPIRNKEEVKAVENYLKRHKEGKRNRLIYAIGINTGLRVSDILGLNISDVIGKTHIDIVEKKTGKKKKFPLNSKLIFLVKDYLQDFYETGPLFLGKQHKRLDRSQVYRFINRACKNLGIEANVGTHTMRKTFGYHHYKQYKDVVILQKIFNHSSQSITLRYIGIEQDDIDMSYQNFEL